MVSTKILSSTTGFNKKCFLEGESAHYNDFWRIMWLKMQKIQLWRHKNNYFFIYIQMKTDFYSICSDHETSFKSIKPKFWTEVYII